MYVYVCVTYKFPNMNHMSMDTVQIFLQTTFHVSAIYHLTNMAATLQIKLTLPSILYGHRCNITAIQVPKHNQVHDFTWYCHVCDRNRHAYQTAIICHIFNGHTWRMYLHICATYEVTGTNQATGSTVHMTVWPTTIKTPNLILHRLCWPIGQITRP